MNRTIATLTLLLGASACAPHDAIMKDITGMKGRPAKEAFTTYGYPTSERIIAGDTVYIWRADGGWDAVPCTMRIIAGPDGLVKTGDIEGSPRACRQL